MIRNEEWHGHIEKAIENCHKQAKQSKDVVEFDFNGVTVQLAGDSDPKLIYRDWSRGMSGYLGEKPTVGPYPAVMLSEAELDSDKKIEAENETRRQESVKKYREEERQKKLLLQGALAVAGPMDVTDQATWDQFAANNKDGYGGRVLRYAEEWARLMQTRLANGESLADFADEMSHLADDDGITGFMYGCAVQALAKCWKHGEALRRWHNKKTQIGTEGDKANESGAVLNPALLSIG